MYFDSSRNYEKKDYTHIIDILDGALHGFNMRGGHIEIREQRKSKRVSRIKLPFAASINRQQARMMDSTSSIS